MKAVRFHQFGGPEVLRVEDLPIPEVGPEGVLIRVAAAGVNYSDLMRRAGSYSPTISLPYALGVEAAGTVERIGEKISGIKAGDRAITLIGIGCQAEYVAAPLGTVYPIPTGLSWEEAGAIPLTSLTAYHLLKTRAQIKPGETVLITAAASGVGTMAVQMARAWGARIFATASTEEKLKLVRELGAEEGINYTKEDLTEEVLKRTGGKGVDVIIESVGGVTLTRCLAALSPGGRICIYGRAEGELPRLDTEQIFIKNQSALGLHLGMPPWTRTIHKLAMAEILGLIAAGGLRPIVDRTFPLAEVRAAHDYLAARRTHGKVLLIP